MAAPRKYLDADRTVVNPDWLAHRGRLRRRLVEDWDLYDDPHRTDIGMYFPEAEGKAIPEGGAWVIVLSEPLTELRERFRVPPLSMWSARPREVSSGALRRVVDGERVTVHPRQAVIITPGGELSLWAHEYVVASEPRALACDPGATIHQLSDDPVIDPERLFYLMSRGIPAHEATLMLFDLIEDPSFCYVTFPDYVTEFFAGHFGVDPVP